MRLTLATILFVSFLPLADAASIDQSLAKLDPEERARQACIIRGIDQIRADKKLPRADRIQPGAEKRAAFSGDVVLAEGGAVRAKDKWYELTFTCAVTPDHMKATSFAYQIGALIPKEKWEDMGLFE